MISDYENGGLKMLHVHNVVHELCIKWMQWLLLGQGNTWLRYIWPKITRSIPAELFKGLQVVSETSLVALDNFYSSMIRSYAFVNNIHYES